MQDRDWDDLRYFLAVARTGSLSGAAKYLGVNHSTVLRRLASLEDALGVRLFGRTPAGYVMTPAGEELRERLKQVAEQIESAQRYVAGRDAELSGAIRLTSTDTLLSGLLTPYLIEFQRRHPRIELQVVSSNAFSSLTKREADVAVRPSNAPPENLVGRAAGRLASAVYGAAAYLESRSAELDGEHRWVGFDDSLRHLNQAKWMEKHVPPEHIVYKADSLVGMVDAVRHGAGLGVLLCLLVDGQPGMVRLGEDLPALDTRVWVLTHPDLRFVARIKALSDFLIAGLGADPRVLPNAGR
ncbi:LysR family transcriptional regulator [Crenobacter cavernae]|uniref:LysR family transcriptional regulator n=1 Tax=Crenobacter cavernae TaxID=2290923 RepID=A0A345Y7Q3_9NEIS|nr:LysR family transcriptional regulator [Crenobacter cavernae]AXK39955.1 LysR family transcriptional regulator [Crenobacter cavernae]